MRFNLHGIVEIPLSTQLTMISSFHYNKQGPHEQLLFGAGGKWFFENSKSSHIQFEINPRIGSGLNAGEITSVAFSTHLQIDSFLFGLAYDRYRYSNSHGLEISLGYIFQ